MSIIYPDKFALVSDDMEPLNIETYGLAYYVKKNDSKEFKQGCPNVFSWIENMHAREHPAPAGWKNTLGDEGRFRKFEIPHSDIDNLAARGINTIRPLPPLYEKLAAWGITTFVPRIDDNSHESKRFYLIPEITVMLTLLNHSFNGGRPGASSDFRKIINKLIQKGFIQSDDINAYHDGDDSKAIFRVPSLRHDPPIVIPLKGPRAEQLFAKLSSLFLHESPSSEWSGAPTANGTIVQREPGWYWVLTSKKYRKPFKKWVALEWCFDKESLNLGLDPYMWLDAEQEEFPGHILDVNESPIPQPESPYAKRS